MPKPAAAQVDHCATAVPKDTRTSRLTEPCSRREQTPGGALLRTRTSCAPGCWHIAPISAIDDSGDAGSAAHFTTSSVEEIRRKAATAPSPSSPITAALRLRQHTSQRSPWAGPHQRTPRPSGPNSWRGLRPVARHLGLRWDWRTGCEPRERSRQPCRHELPVAARTSGRAAWCFAGDPSPGRRPQQRQCHWCRG